jgi:hypothetical protein
VLDYTLIALVESESGSLTHCFQRNSAISEVA